MPEAIPVIVTHLTLSNRAEGPEENSRVCALDELVRDVVGKPERPPLSIYVLRRVQSLAEFLYVLVKGKTVRALALLKVTSPHSVD